MHPYLGDQDRVTAYGLMLALAICACWWLARRNAARSGVDPSHVDLLLPLALLAAIAGTVLLSSFDPGAGPVPGVSQGTGPHIRLIPVILFCTVTVYVYARSTGQSFVAFLDLLTVPTLVAVTIQRGGCFLAGCCWGDIAVDPGALDALGDAAIRSQVLTLPWAAGDWVLTAVRFPVGSFAYEQHLSLGLIAADAQASLPVHPTQLYEAALLVPVIVVLQKTGLNRRPRGSLALLGIAAYTLIRFGMDFLRADQAVFVADLTITQLQCIVLFLGACAAMRMNTNARH